MRLICALVVIAAVGLTFSWRFPTISVKSVKNHLSSRTLYTHKRPIPGGRPFDDPLPEGHKPQYLHFVGRHGTRWPTQKRMDQYSTLFNLFQVTNGSGPSWTRDWQTPFKDIEDIAGHLHPSGELEMRELGSRFRQRFPELLSTYNHVQHKVISTQVPRASASAIALAQGLFPCSANTSSQQGPQAQCCLPQPVSLFMRPKHDDPLLRFFKLSPEFDEYLERLNPQLRVWESEMWTPMLGKIGKRLGLPEGYLRPQEVGSLWQMCQQEASLFGECNHACSLFDKQDVDQMEYIEDVVAFSKKGYLCSQAYTMASGLLMDIRDALSEASVGVKARFHVAHAETVSPLAAALGLFGAPQNLTVNQTCAASWTASLPPPPETRPWWAASVIPFGANLALLVHSHVSNPGPSYVRLYWNEQAISTPAAPLDLDCELGRFTDYLQSRLEAMTG